MFYKIIVFLILIVVHNTCYCEQEGKYKNVEPNGKHNKVIDTYIKSGDLYFSKNQYDSAYYFYSQYLNSASDTLNFAHIADCINAIGVYKSNENKYNEAIYYLIKSLKTFEKINNRRGIAFCYSNIAIAFAENYYYDKALDFFNLSIKIFLEINHLEGIVGSAINYGHVCLKQEKYDLAEKYFIIALKILKKYDSDYSIGLIYDNLGITQSELAERITDNELKNAKFDSAKNFLEQALFYYRKKNDLWGESIVLFDISLIYKKLKMYNKAIKYADSSLMICKQSGFLLTESKIYESLSDIYKKLNNFEKAFEYSVLFKQYNDSVFNLDKNKQLQEIFIKYETEKKEKEISNQYGQIKLLKKEQELSKFKIWGLWLFGIMSVIILVVVFISLRRRIKTNKQIYEHKMRYIASLKQIADVELINQKLQSEHLQNELKYKKQEITNLAMHLAERNDFLKEIKNKLLKIHETEPKVIIKYIEQCLMVLEDERKEFEKHIENINETYYIRLRQTVPSITKNEERLATLLKLNLTSKEIAIILNISPKSVDMSRYRLRKKLNINTDDSLADFLNSI